MNAQLVWIITLFKGPHCFGAFNAPRLLFFMLQCNMTCAFAFIYVAVLTGSQSGCGPPSPEQKSKSYSSTRLFVCRCCLTCPSFYVSSWWFLTESVNIKEKYTILYSKRAFVAFVMVVSGRSGNGERAQMSRHWIHVYHNRTNEIVRQYCCSKTTKKRLRESPFQLSNAPHGVWLQVLLSHGCKRQKQMLHSSFTDPLDLIFWIDNGCFELTCKVELVLQALGGEKHSLHALPVLELDVGTGHTALVILLCWERMSS